MKVKIEQLEDGCILTSDVSVLASQPLMKKNTVLTKELLEILDVFMVDNVEVEPKLVNGERFNPKEVIIEEKEISKKQEEMDKKLIDQYLEVVQKYKKLFNGWQSGLKIDVSEIRKMIIPLFELAFKHPDDLLLLHHYSTKDDYIYHHSVFVGILSAYLGKKMKFTQAEWVQVGFAGIMADAGMSKIPHKIILKTGSLTQEEFEEIKKHPIYSYRMLKGQKGVTDEVLLAVLQHHERKDGTGYPLGVEAAKLHRFSQIIFLSNRH